MADLDDLIDVAQGQSNMQKHYAGETQTYNGVKRALETGVLAKGRPASEIRARYGEPVVTLWDRDKNMEKWIYKSASSSFFDGEQVYLFFDKDCTLVETEMRKKDDAAR